MPNSHALTVDSNPFIEIFPLRQHYSLPQVSAAQCCLRMFQQFILVGSFWDILLGFEGFGWATTTVGRKRWRLSIYQDTVGTMTTLDRNPFGFLVQSTVVGRHLCQHGKTCLKVSFNHATMFSSGLVRPNPNCMICVICHQSTKLRRLPTLSHKMENAQLVPRSSKCYTKYEIYYLQTIKVWIMKR